MTRSPRDRNDVGELSVLPRAREEVIYSRDSTRVVKVFPADHGPVVIRKESVGADALEGLRHERDMLRRLAGVDGVPQLIDGEQRADWLLMADRGARPITDAATLGSL